MSFLRKVAAGAVAGAVGTSAMDLLLFARYRRDGGKERLWRWELAGDVMSWDDASAPGQLGRKALRQVTGHDPRTNGLDPRPTSCTGRPASGGA